MSTAPTPPAAGLRERTKLRRRRLILHTALRLFAERGYDETTIADIAEAADVARRTVTGYFPAKLDFVAAYPGGLADRLRSLHEDHPEADFLELTGLWWDDVRDGLDLEVAELAAEVGRTNPAVAAMADAQVSHAMAEGGYSLAAYTGRDRDDLVQVAGRTSIHAINLTFFRGLAERRMTDDLQRRLLALVREIAEATRRPA